jgi:hypothetical protein
MTPRRLAMLLLTITVVGAGIYVLLYLYRWEWNRALTAGMFVIVAEVALVAMTLQGRLRRIEDRLGAGAPVPDQLLARLQESRPEPRQHFAWLQPSDRFGVFVPVLMGAGVILSGLAWVVERLAKATARPALERGLAQKLGPFTMTHRSLVPAREPAVSMVPAVLLRPGRRS